MSKTSKDTPKILPRRKAIPDTRSVQTRFDERYSSYKTTLKEKLDGRTGNGGKKCRYEVEHRFHHEVAQLIRTARRKGEKLRVPAQVMRALEKERKALS